MVVCYSALGGFCDFVFIFCSNESETLFLCVWLVSALLSEWFVCCKPLLVFKSSTCSWWQQPFFFFKNDSGSEQVWFVPTLLPQ